jgi:hypothetical protein
MNWQIKKTVYSCINKGDIEEIRAVIRIDR